jgi:RimJ/RimL family protein N-acetyltransferase
MTRAVTAVVDDLLTVRGFNRVVIAVQPDNWRSRALAGRLGFSAAAVARQVAIVQGRSIDWVI